MMTAERLDRDALTAVQGRRLTELVSAIYRRNTFYTRKFDDANSATAIIVCAIEDEIVAGARKADVVVVSGNDDVGVAEFFIGAAQEANHVARHAVANGCGLQVSPVDRFEPGFLELICDIGGCFIKPWRRSGSSFKFVGGKVGEICAK